MLEQSAAHGAGSADGLVGEPDQRGPAQQVVGEGGDHGPGGVGGVVAGGEVREGLVFEVADRLLDDGVLAVFGLDEGDRFGAVGDEREVPPVGPQLGLRADEAGAADDQPAVTEVVSAICASPSSG